MKTFSIGDLNKGKQLSDEVKEKISNSLKGRLVWNKGLKWSDEVKEKISKSKKLNKKEVKNDK